MQALLRGHGPTPNYYRGAAFNPNGVYWWVAPNYPEISNSKIWKHLQKACRGVMKEPNGKSELERTLTLTNGATVSVRSADKADTLRGPGLDGLVVDEAAMVSEDAWKEVLRPALADKQGWAMFCSTPKGRNWFHEMFERAGGDGALWAAWQLPTADNPIVTAGELAQIKDEVGPRRFGQEHEAKFLEIEGALFPSDYFGAHIWADEWPDSFEVGVVSIDPSMGKDTQRGDYSAIVFAGLAGNTVWVDVDLERRPPTQIVEDATRMWARYGAMSIGCESVGFQEIMATVFQMYASQNRIVATQVEPIDNYRVSKEKRIQRLDAPLYNRLLRFKDNEGGRMCIEQLQMFPTKGVHDDGPDGLEMALRMLDQWAAGRLDGVEPEFVRA